MKITENSQLLNTLSNDKRVAKSSDFGDILSSNIKILQNKQEMQESIDKFKKDLTKYGTYAFLAKLNEDKIEEKVAKKKAELIETFGLNDPAKAKQKEQITKLIQDMLAEYKKELMRKNQSNTLLERSQNLSGNKQMGITLASLLSGI
ncbi:hypothetical protein U5B43_01570 [Campylobacter sp. 9BO]|uniref:hypothetical protein n=1 Tax=Campylobacter sp. 9BO TaxID=3424759 RepID=UPI003D344097